ncbi:MAG: hypothetical protein MUF81_08000 [Verrucomicrobia bacterium]|jgi:hypothetical protein|nr:hypothetical protein [Verrucomicrobiota bacterium]
MGLTIHYKLSVTENLSSAVVRELIQRTALYSWKIGCAEVSEVMPADADPIYSRLFVRAGEERDCCFGHVPAKRGWLVEVWPGEGCESATFGLCQYPRRAPYELRGKSGFVATDYKGGWLFKGHCKTQYAGEHGWEHFLRCHKIIVSILDFWRQMGVAVEVNDEGEYWETRSEEKLRGRLKAYDGLIAAVAGVFKDATDTSGKGHSVASPIFARNDFERLEAEGWQEFGNRISQLAGALPRETR